MKYHSVDNDVVKSNYSELYKIHKGLSKDANIPKETKTDKKYSATMSIHEMGSRLLDAATIHEQFTDMAA